MTPRENINLTHSAGRSTGEAWNWHAAGSTLALSFKHAGTGFKHPTRAPRCRHSQQFNLHSSRNNLPSRERRNQLWHRASLAQDAADCLSWISTGRGLFGALANCFSSFCGRCKRVQKFKLTCHDQLAAQRRAMLFTRALSRASTHDIQNRLRANPHQEAICWQRQMYPNDLHRH